MIIVWFIDNGLVQVVDCEKGEIVGFEFFGYFFDFYIGGDQFFLIGYVDVVEVWEFDWWIG